MSLACTAWMRQSSTGLCWMSQQTGAVEWEYAVDYNGGLRCSVSNMADMSSSSFSSIFHVIILFFSENYFSIILSSEMKEIFLQECSVFLSPVNCIDVFNGSTAVTLMGTDQQFQNATTFLQQNGMKLPSFPMLILKEISQSTLRNDNIQRNSVQFSPIYVAIILLICCVGIISFMIRRSYRKAKSKCGVISMNMNDDIRIPLCPMDEILSKKSKITWTRCTDLQTSFIPLDPDEKSMGTDRHRRD